jgi:hypothetical protein
MNKATEFIIDLVANRVPYNAHLVLPPEAFNKLYPYLEIAIYSGQVSTDEYNRIVLDLNLDNQLMAYLTKVAQTASNRSIIASIPYHEN